MDGSGGGGRRLVALAALVGLPWLVLAGPAAAQDVGTDPLDCDAVVVDDAGVLDTSTVVAEALAVESAQVIVRSFVSVPDGDIIATVDDLIADCFADEEGDIDADLALFSFSVDDRAADVFLGSALPGDTIPTDLVDTMTARFPDEDYTQGVIDAIDELDRLLGGSADPATGGADEPAPVDPGTQDAGDGGGDGAPAGLIAGAVAVAGAGAGAVVMVTRRRRLTAARNELAATVSGPRVRVGSVREQAARLENQAELWGKVATGTTLEALHDLRHRARTATNETERAAALLSEATPDGIANASMEQVAHATERVAELREALDRNEKSLDELFSLGARLDHLRVALPAKKQLLLEELAAADELAATRRREGWLASEPEAEIDAVRAEVESIDLTDFALDLLALSERLEIAEARLFASEHDLQSLPDRPGSLAEWRERQHQAAELERRRIDSARAALSAAAEVHGEESWRWAADHPDEAREHLRRFEQLAERAETLAASQRFDDAGLALEQAGMQLIGADDLLDQVEDLMVDLDQAKIEAPDILAESRQVADEFGTYVERHRRDLDERLVAKPQFLDETLDGLELELLQPRPNYLRVAQSADRFNRELDELLAAAAAQHERMEALRRQAEREVARARRGIRRARQSLGWQLFPSREARLLDELEERLGALPADPAARLEVAQDLADEAVEVQELVIARRRRGGNWVIVGGGGGGAWGGSSSSSGTGGGRSFGGGGGGISFGGGGGGRSFGGGRGTGSW